MTTSWGICCFAEIPGGICCFNATPRWKRAQDELRRGFRKSRLGDWDDVPLRVALIRLCFPYSPADAAAPIDYSHVHQPR